MDFGSKKGGRRKRKAEHDNRRKAGDEGVG